MTETAEAPPTTDTLAEWLEEPFDPEKLLPWEEQVKKGALDGYFVKLAPAVLAGETDSDGPTIRARFLEALLLGGLGEVHHRGVCFRASAPKDQPARIIGALNLCGAGAAGQPLPILEIYGFGFAQRPNFDLAHLTFLLLNACKFAEGLDLQRADIRGGLFLRGIESKGEINLNSSTIGGQLVFEGAKLRHNTTSALHANDATIKGSVSLRGAEAKGEINLNGVTIGGQLVLAGTRLSHKNGWALHASGATIAGGLFAKEYEGFPGLVAWGGISFVGASVIGPFEWDGAVLLSGTVDRPAIMARNLDLSGQAFFYRGANGRPFVALGGARFDRARLGGPVDAMDAVIAAPEVIGQNNSVGAWRALDLNDAAAERGLDLRGATVLGATSLDGRRLEGDVRLDDASLVAAGSTVKEGQNGLPWEEYADFTKVGVALSAVRTTIKGALQMRRFRAPDPSILDTIEIEPLDPEFFGKEASEEFVKAFEDAIGKTRAFMEEAKARCSPVDDEAKHHHPQGHFLMWNAEIGSLQDDVDHSYPKEFGQLHLDGLKYHHLAVKPRHEDPEKRWVGNRRVEWLRRQYPEGKAKEGHFHPQPYDHLSATLRAQGYGRAANTVGAEKRKDARLSKAEQWWDREVVSRIYSLTSNSGYSTVQATAVYVSALTTAVIITALFYAYDGLAIATTKRTMAPETLSWPIFSDLIGYTVDLFVPLLRFGSESRFEPTASWVGELAGLWTYLVRIAGLILTGILALTYTGVTRKD